MTEDQIERRVEKMMDHLDRVFLAGGMSQDSYDQAVRSLDQWAERKITEAIRTGRGRND
jgi:cob(I)alamin adenosyltransferase